jgi:hypothetical protein
MKTIVGLLLCIAGLAGIASAQTKISGVGKCGKPDIQQSVDVGDRAGHMLVLVKQSCTWTTPMEMAGLKSKTYTGAVVSDAAADKAQDRGYVVMVMENGDKAFVRFTGAAVFKDGKPVSGEGTWSYTGGTGKLRGLTGKGTYKSTPTADGGDEDQVEGDYSLPANTKK